MWQGALGLAVALLTASCASTPSTTATRIAFADACTRRGITTPDEFADAKVAMLAPGFDVTGNPTGTRYREPKSAGSVDPTIRKDLSAAFQLADPDFQAQLCSLEQVFVDNDHRGIPIGWGFWENPRDQLDEKNVARQRMYIGLPAELWTARPSLLDVENRTFASLLRRGHGTWEKWDAERPRYTSSDRNDFSWALLSILAHEMGHIVYVKADLARDQSLRACQSRSWESLGRRARFRDFGDETGRHREPFPTQVDFAVSEDNKPSTDKALAQIYGVRASLLAAASPDEDFVESYRLDVLSRAGLGSLVFEIPRINTSFNVLSRSGRGRDGAKCVAAFAARQRLQPRR